MCLVGTADLARDGSLRAHAPRGRLRRRDAPDGPRSPRRREVHPFERALERLEFTTERARIAHGARGLELQRPGRLRHGSALLATPEEGAEETGEAAEGEEELRDEEGACAHERVRGVGVVVSERQERVHRDLRVVPREPFDDPVDVTAEPPSIRPDGYERPSLSLLADPDPRSQAELSADDMVSGAFGRDLSRQQNAYQQQFQDQATQFDQRNTNRGMATAEQAQRFGQQGQNAELGMRGQAQGYNQAAQNRQQYIAELLSQRQTPLNEILALMGGSQVNNPFAVGGFNGNQQVAPAPIFGATQAQGQWDANRYNQRVGSYNNMMSGLFSLGAAAVGGPSDIRLKSKIVKVGEHPLGIGIYEYDIFGHRERGVMAQELQAVMPEAVPPVRS